MNLKWYIHMSEGYLVDVDSRFEYARFSEELAKAKGFLTEDNAEIVAHKLWLSGFGEYELRHEPEPDSEARRGIIRLNAVDYALMAYMKGLTKRLDAAQIQLTFKPGGNFGSDKMWELTVVDQGCFFKTRVGATPQEASDRLVAAMTPAGDTSQSIIEES